MLVLDRKPAGSATISDFRELLKPLEPSLEELASRDLKT